VGVRVGVPPQRNKLGLHTRNLNLRYQPSIFVSFRDISVHMDDFLKFVRFRMGVATFFLGQSMSIYENNKFQ